MISFFLVFKQTEQKHQSRIKQ